ncbi:MAG TPA: dTMP kinase [Clostridia bacterium]|nr:dTMP kinase [Clostridia bacterium]
MEGKWISFEGGEGSGKTTLIKGLVEKLEERNLPYLLTREPGGVPVAEKVREILLEKTDRPMDAMTEAILFAASRRQHLVEKVLPALTEGKIVLMDRYVDSSIVYQGYARGLGMEKIKALNEFATDGHLPIITFYLDLAPQKGLERIIENKRLMNRLDDENLDFHKKIREGYLLLCEKEDRLRCLDADKRPQQLLEEVWEIIAKEIL